jgi:O-antigen/teichoic acid export membrane protein
MASPSYATPPRPARDSTTLTGPHSDPAAASMPAASLIARVRAILADRSDSRLAQLIAGKVFLVRVASALLALLSQVLLARWMGRFEFGVYIYVWTFVLMIGSLTDVGLGSAARRFIPEYIELNERDRLRGFLSGSRWLVVAIAAAIGAAGAIGVTLARPWLAAYTVVPLYLACAALPVYGLGQLQAGIAQSYNWPLLALTPFFLWRQLALTLLVGAIFVVGLETNAIVAMIIAVATSWMVTLGQSWMLNRRLARSTEPGKKHYEPRIWLATSLPILVVEGFYLLLTYVDILALEHYRSPDEVAVYYAAARILAVVAFVYFAIAGATTHKFTEYYVAGDHERLAKFFGETIRWTFWPSLAACALILLFGHPLLSLFGSGFTSGYLVMFILAAGMLARAAVGPAERLLNMIGERKQCAMVYAAAFAVNLSLCVLLIPHAGIEGAATATSVALIVESITLYAMTRRRLGHHLFILRHADR